MRTPTVLSLLADAFVAFPCFAMGNPSAATAPASPSNPAVLAAPNPGSYVVCGHTTKSGTNVEPHRATNPDDTKANNWSTKGNVNPCTGKTHTK